MSSVVKSSTRESSLVERHGLQRNYAQAPTDARCDKTVEAWPTKAMSTSHESETVAEFVQSHFSATVWTGLKCATDLERLHC